jgi:hypothetical protein
VNGKSSSGSHDTSSILPVHFHSFDPTYENRHHMQQLCDFQDTFDCFSFGCNKSWKTTNFCFYFVAQARRKPVGVAASSAAPRLFGGQISEEEVVMNHHE